jgi:hypothetical protein
MKDWQSEFAELDKGATELSTDCEHFGLPKPVSACDIRSIFCVCPEPALVN